MGDGQRDRSGPKRTWLFLRRPANTGPFSCPRIPPCRRTGRASDRCVPAGAMAEQGIHPAPAADRRTLVRRAYLDLIGLPPTPAEVDELPERHLARRLGAPDRPPARLAALRRALGTPLARRGALRRLQRLRARLRPAQRLALSRLRDSLVQQGQALRQLPAASSSPATNSTRSPTTRLIATGFLRSYAKVRLPREGQPAVPLRLSRRHDRDDRARRPGPDGEVRALPRPQVRSRSRRRTTTA